MSVTVSIADEAFLKQKARIQWVQLGDQNNSFLSYFKVRNAKNWIHHLWDEQGLWVGEERQIKRAAVDFYKNLLCVYHLFKMPWSILCVN